LLLNNEPITPRKHENDQTRHDASNQPAPFRQTTTLTMFLRSLFFLNREQMKLEEIRVEDLYPYLLVDIPIEGDVDEALGQYYEETTRRAEETRQTVNSDGDAGRGHSK
jgi:hypothetical protein